MSMVLYEEYFHQLRLKECMVGRKILSMVDNCPTHPKIIKGLRNVNFFFFFPTKHNFKIQPRDAKIKRVCKMHYCFDYIEKSLKG